MKIDDKHDVIWLEDASDLAFVTGKDRLTIVKELLNFDRSHYLIPMFDYFYDAPTEEKECLISAIIDGYVFLKKCICEGAKLTFDVHEGDDGVMVIRDNRLIMEGDVNYEYLTSFEHDINFCPMCGRNLKE